ncbi:RNA-binding protein [Chryseobacterium lacus]|uniref:RNA-binding protein n=1 Tax=Chryseobacterium lacus TaxID=2058346 RepID=A0A368MWV3_9FLAO|nr:RNA-binding protein [Chryseobacterium lacus]RCU42410.1 RNA-binding protein [Chryseobacterium lacus]RST26968.1 RNA-binding protein [Chryseobacterium lacus]
MNIFISNLNYNTVESELQALFENYGEVESAKIITDRETGRSRGFGFVEMPENEDALKAIEELNQKEFKQKVLNVSEARPKEQKPRSFGGNGGGGGYNRGGNDRRRDW